MITVYKFSAKWCGPCRTLAEPFKNFKAINADVTFIDIDTDDNPEMAENFGVRGLPTVVVTKNNNIEKVIVGQKPISEYQSVLDEVKLAK